MTFKYRLVVVAAGVFAFFAASEKLVSADWTGTGGAQTCTVTSAVDSLSDQNSFRRKVERGYNVTNQSFCRDRIVLNTDVQLNAPLTIGNSVDGDGVVIEGNGSPKTITFVGDCGLILNSDRITLKNVLVRGAHGAAVCVRSNFNTLENLVAESNNVGVRVEGTGTKVRESVFRNNSDAGVTLAAANNEITHNSYYNNGQPLISPEAATKPTIQFAARSSASEFTVFLTLAADVQRVELYRLYPVSGQQTLIVSTSDIVARTVTATFPASSGESVFAVSFRNGSTSAVSNVVALSEFPEGSGGSSPGVCTGGPVDPATEVTRFCTRGFGSAPLQDSDCDGILDNNEDKNKNCIWDPSEGETDAQNSDTDGDGIYDGLEDANKNGQYDAPNETNALYEDTDGDHIPDGLEDRDHNGYRNLTESDPRKKDTDGDGIDDEHEDKNRNGLYDAGQETKAYDDDTDQDNLPDGAEDRNKNGLVESWESNPRDADTDHDGLSDGADPCPVNPNLLCFSQCVPNTVPNPDSDGGGDGGSSTPPRAPFDPVITGTLQQVRFLKKDAQKKAFEAASTAKTAPVTASALTVESGDADQDGLPDFEEDLNGNCRVDAGETDPYNRDTDGDGISDRYDPCPLNPDTSCDSACVSGAPVPAHYDSDADGAPNVAEDSNQNCIQDANETDPQNPDTDGDGLTDGIERQAGLDPLRPDTDNDGLKDGAEDFNHDGVVQAWELDPKNPDTDGDGESDLIDACPRNPDPECANECFHGQEPPAAKDSDGDGLPDRIEDLNHDCIRSPNETDAYSRDTDGDGLIDSLEDRNLNGQVDAGETDPRNPDSDGDGISDGAEDHNQNGRLDFEECNPLSIDTDGDGIPDNREDRNKNGVMDEDESGCGLADTDFDGAPDGQEDKNHNGVYDPGETSAIQTDTDGDGAPDGLDPRPSISSGSDLHQVTGRGGCSLIRS